MDYRNDPEQFDNQSLYHATQEDWEEYQSWLDDNEGQPTEYEEWQDVYGGDDWDHGQYDNYDEY